MRVVVIGCGRVGSLLATTLSADGHDVVVIDRDRAAFASLGSEFNGETVVGTGIDEDVLRQAGIEEADACAAVTNEDNTNIMAAQVARHIFQVPRVIARIYDPAREATYHQFGLETVSTTHIGVTVIRNLLTTDNFRYRDKLGAGEAGTVETGVKEGLAGETVGRGRRKMFVVVVGGGKVGYYLAKTLVSRGHEVTVIEKVPELCERIAHDMGVRVINGDGTDPAILADADADQAGVIAAVAGHDEENLVVCQVAKRNFQVPRAVARINNPKNERIFTMLGVDAAISGTAILARMIEQEIDVVELRTLLTFKRGELEIVEAEVTPASPLVNRPLREAAVPPDSVLTTVIRGEEVIFPRGDTVLKAGDTVMAVTRRGREDALRAALVGRKGQG